MAPAVCGRFMQYTLFNFCNLTQSIIKNGMTLMCMNIDSVLDDIMSVESLSLLGPDMYISGLVKHKRILVSNSESGFCPLRLNKFGRPVWSVW